MPDPLIAFRVHTQGGRKCPFCDKAIELLKAKGYKAIHNSHSLSDIKAIAERANMTTVPIIYHGVKLIGGYTELEQYLSDET